MRKALLHIFFLSLLLNTGLAHAVVVPHDAMAATSTQNEGQESKYAVADNGGGSIFCKDFTITDWDDYDECDFDDHTTSLSGKGYLTAVSSVNENRFAARYICNSSKGKIYSDLNFSRLPRYNYISLRVLRI